MNVREIYDREIAQRGFMADASQLQAIAALERCAQAWAAYKRQRSSYVKKLLLRPPIPRGVYLHGGVGRGKSFLMDCFFEAVSLRRKVRLHFHEFMHEVHGQLRRLQGRQNPLHALAERMAQRHKLICFDEFHIANITDAMVLYRLLEALNTHGVGLVMTSNFAPDALYPGGLNRERILPAIALLQTQMEVVPVDHGTDYRRVLLEQLKGYYYPINTAAQNALQDTWRRLCSGREETGMLTLEGHRLRPLRWCTEAVWFDFATLCGGPRSQNDYLALAQRFHTVVLSDVPQLTPAMASAARRFTWLVDVLYDRRVKLVMAAAVAEAQLYPQGVLAHEFVRTVSRLREMQSQSYRASSRREVDTGIVMPALPD